MKTAYIIGGELSYGLGKLFHHWGFKVVNSVKEAAIVVYRGGIDIDPHIYAPRAHSKCYSWSAIRDTQEIDVYHEAKRLGIPQVGICRGAQLLNVLNGGTLFQHVDGHHRRHDIFSLDGEPLLLKATSIHHQMMIPTTEAEILGVACESSERHFVAQDGKEVKEVGPHDDPEIVYYDGALCWQGHPECASLEEEKLFFKIIKEKFNL